MPKYMVSFSYSSDSVRGMVHSPQDRRIVVEKLINAGGGTLECMYFTFGDHDGFAIAEFPSNTDVAAVLLTVGASGGFSALKTTVLISTEEAKTAMEKAGAIAAAFTAPNAS